MNTDPNGGNDPSQRSVFQVIMEQLAQAPPGQQNLLNYADLQNIQQQLHMLPQLNLPNLPPQHLLAPSYNQIAQLAALHAAQAQASPQPRQFIPTPQPPPLQNPPQQFNLFQHQQQHQQLLQQAPAPAPIPPTPQIAPPAPVEIPPQPVGNIAEQANMIISSLERTMTQEQAPPPPAPPRPPPVPMNYHIVPLNQPGGPAVPVISQHHLTQQQQTPVLQVIQQQQAAAAQQRIVAHPPIEGVIRQPVAAPAQAPPQAPPQAYPEPKRRRPGAGRKRKEPEGPPRVDEALAYLRVIKQTFATDIPVYHKFLEIMKNFRAQRIDTPDVIEQVAELLYSSPDLVLGFNTFLPNGYQISLTPDKKYVFTSPASQPRVLPSPSERERAAAADRKSDEEESAGSDDERPGPAPAPAQAAAESDGNESDASMQDEEEDVEDEAETIHEEIISLAKYAGEPPFKTAKIGPGMEEETLKIFKHVFMCFLARPEKLVKFKGWMDYFLKHCLFYKENQIKEDRSTTPDKDIPGPAPPERHPESPEGEVKSEEVEEGGDDTVELEQSLDETLKNEIKVTSWDHLVTILAGVCSGDSTLLALLLNYFPILKAHIVKLGDQYVQRILKILGETTLDVNPAEEGLIEKVDAELKEALIASSLIPAENSADKLKIWAMADVDDKDKDNMALFLDYNDRILFEHLKRRLSKPQLRNFLLLISLYMNVQITKEKLVEELPKVMGCPNTEAELMIRKMLGLEKREEDRPENDPDAETRADLPAKTHGKRGLRDQKLMQQAKTVNLATVCTLGPSYRLMKGEREEEFEGRKELDPLLKSVLNDTWTSYPSWSSEEAGTTTVKKSNLEEFHCKTEDERYEMDIIVDSNRTIIEQLQKTLRDLKLMNETQKKDFKLDEKLNCSSKATLDRVLTKVYTNQAGKMVDLTRSNPETGINQILEGLIEKDQAWSKFQQETNRAWREACDKTMTANMNTLNNQQRAYDQKAFKAKMLINQIEEQYEKRKKSGEPDTEEHLTLEYSPDARVYRDVNDVTGFFFNELPGGKYDKDRSKIVLFSYRILMEWVCQPAQHVEINMTNGETFTFNGDSHEDENLIALLSMDGRNLSGERVIPDTGTINIISPPANMTVAEKFQHELHHVPRRIFYGDDNVYIFIRFHHCAIERFAKILATQAMLNEEHFESQKKTDKWLEGAGAELNSQKVLEQNMKERREAVYDIRNIRSDTASYYDMTLREMKSLGNNQIDSATFEENVRQYFPGDVAILYSIDKLFSTLAKNIHLATTGDSSENPIKLYLKYRKPMMEAKTPEELQKIEAEYAAEAEENLRGKNTYRFEFVQNQGNPQCKIWLIQREEKEDSEPEDVDDDGKDDKEAEVDAEKKDTETDEIATPQHPASNDGDDEEMADEAAEDVADEHDEEMEEAPAAL